MNAQEIKSEIKSIAYDLMNIKVIGYTTDFNECDCCGRTGLKGTVTIVDTNTDAICHLGTTCAANTEKYASLDAWNKAKKEVNKAVRDFNNEVKKAAERLARVKNMASKQIELLKVDAAQSEIDSFVTFALEGNNENDFVWSNGATMAEYNYQAIVKWLERIIERDKKDLSELPNKDKDIAKKVVEGMEYSFKDYVSQYEYRKEERELITKHFAEIKAAK